MILPVTERSQVAEARRQVSELATAQGLDATAVGRAAILATELATNLIKHAGGGEILLSPFSDCDGSGVELLSLDRGPGIADVQKSLVDGHSTTGSAGSGLGSVRRNADVFAIFTRVSQGEVGQGTAVLARIKGAEPTSSAARYVISAVQATYPGESVCGDGWAAKTAGRSLLVMLADGSGHGPAAYAAAARAKEIFAGSVQAPVVQIGENIHRALGATRGAAIAVAEVEPASDAGSGGGQVNFVGVGNISAALLDGGQVRRMISNNGTAGHVAPRIRMFQYPFAAEPTVILHSDGLTSRWDLSGYPGLAAAHPSLIAGILYRDYRRGRDDASIVAVRRNQIVQPHSQREP